MSRVAAARRGHSGLQLQVLGMYKAFLRSVLRKPGGSERDALLEHVRCKFKDGAAIPRTEIDVIERRLRDAKKKLKLLQMSGTESITVVGR